MSYLFLDKPFAELLKEKINSNHKKWEEIKQSLINRAEEAMEKGPWSVTFYKSSAVSGDPHDYYSEAPYWWPDPSNPEGPYIRKDGDWNTGRYIKHRVALEEFSNNVLILSLAGFYLEEKKYVDQVINLVKIWFVNSETRMNPHLEFAQAIPGICTGRSIGIIDTTHLIKVVYGLSYFDKLPEYKDVLAKVKDWFIDYLSWLTKSEKGLDEKNNRNNHTTWWNTQAAAFSIFLEIEELFQNSIKIFKEDIIPNQMSEKGSFPEELLRTRSFHYSLYNLHPCSMLCQMAYCKGIDLWHWKTEDGKGMEKAFEFILPYMKNPDLWEYKEINPQSPSENLSLQLGSVHLDIDNCKKFNQELGKKSSYEIVIAEGNEGLLGPLAMLPGNVLFAHDCSRNSHYKTPRK